MNVRVRTLEHVFSLLEKRWWQMSDTNAPDLVVKHAPSFSESWRDWYLHTNSSLLEQPSGHHDYKLILEDVHEPHSNNDENAHYIIDDDGQLHPDEHNPQVYVGQAYRKLEVALLNGETQIRWRRVGWARAVVGNHVRAVWKVDDQVGLGVPAAVYHLGPVGEGPLHGVHVDGQHAVWRDVDVPGVRTQQVVLDSLTSQSLDFSGDVVGPVTDEEIALHKRQLDKRDLSSSIGKTKGCPSPRKVALIGVAADCNYLGKFNSTASAREHIISSISEASHAYEKAFNITLGLAKLVLANTTCPDTATADTPWNYKCGGKSVNSTSIKNSTAMSDRLSAISQWRGQSDRHGDGMATWTLMTTCATDSVVGLSWLGLACVGDAQVNGGSGISSSDGSTDKQNSYMAGANVISATSLDWRVIAHEIGHSFGAVHDCTKETCAQDLQKTSQCCPLSATAGSCDAAGSYIMNPSVTESSDGFSPCTVGNVCSMLGNRNVDGSCLTSNSNLNLVSKNQCGNGIVEDGEECDCGGETGCKDNTCCDAKTCKFTTGSKCDPTNDECCTDKCQFAPATTVCRASTGPCDPEEKCPGDSTTCPVDKHSPNGDKCTNPSDKADKGLTCISGRCTSRDQQCTDVLKNQTVIVSGKKVSVSVACKDDSLCILSCADPAQPNYCFTISQFFLDGTPCGGKGKCLRGRCVGGNPFSSGSGLLSPWFSGNRRIAVIVVVAIAVILVLLTLYSCVYKPMRARRNLGGHIPLKTYPVSNPAPPPGPPPNFLMPPAPPPPYVAPYNSNPSNGPWPHQPPPAAPPGTHGSHAPF